MLNPGSIAHPERESHVKSRIRKHTSAVVVLKHVSLNPNTRLNTAENGPGIIVPILYPGTAKQRAVRAHAPCTSPDEAGTSPRSPDEEEWKNTSV